MHQHHLCVQKNVQEGFDPELSLENMAGFEGSHGLYADLASGRVPAFSFIAPDQCDDQHGQSNAGPVCAFVEIHQGRDATDLVNEQRKVDSHNDSKYRVVKGRFNLR